MSYTWRRLSRDPLALVGMATIAAVSFAALGAPAIAPFDPTEQFFDGLTLEGAPLAPGEQFLLGTDLLGRDLLSRLLYGARTSLVISVVANGAAVAVGTLLGVVAGYVQGWVGAAVGLPLPPALPEGAGGLSGCAAGPEGHRRRGASAPGRLSSPLIEARTAATLRA